MKFNEMYRAVTELYTGNKSISETAKALGISIVKTRRILITEGLWSSKTSRKICALYAKGLTTESISKELGIGRKNVQAYIPYSRGMYGDTETKDSIRSKLYRTRKNTLKESARMPFALILRDEEIAESANSSDEYRQIKIGESIPFIPKESYVLKLELAGAGEEPINKELLFYAKAGNSISRTVIVPGNMTLHSLHYLISKAFGLHGIHPHNFALSEADFRRLTSNNYSLWNKYCGVLFAAPETADSADRYYDDDYDGSYSYNKWLASKYLKQEPFFCASESYIYQKETACEPDKVTTKLTEEYRNLLERLTLSEILTSDSVTDESVLENTVNAIKNVEKQLMVSEVDKTELVSAIRKYISLYESILKLNESCRGRIRKNSPEEWMLSDYKQKLIKLQKQILPAIVSGNPILEPFTNKLIYRYESGNKWKIQISCIKRIPGRIERPVCTESDGLNLMEDCGGISGGRKNKPENIL